MPRDGSAADDWAADPDAPPGSQPGSQQGSQQGPGQKSKQGRLAVGVDRADITPELPAALAGFAFRTEPVTKILARLHLRTIAFVQSGAEPVVLVSADLLWWGDAVVQRARQEVAAATGLAPHRLILHATHNHSGPQTATQMAPSLGLPDQAYLDRLVGQLVGSVRRALVAPVPVRIESGSADGIAVVDRRSARTAGRVPAGEVDDTLTTVRFIDDRDQTVCVLVHLACHPVVHHGDAVTSDLMGTLADVLERDTAPVVIPLQGCCGDVNPARYRPDGTYVAGGQPEVEREAEALAVLARQALASATDTGTGQLGIRRRELALPLQQPAPGWLLDSLSSEPGRLGEWAGLRRGEVARPDPVLQLVRLDLTDRLSLLGMSGEPVSRYGLRVRQASEGRVLPLGYTDGMTCYLVTAQQWAEGGYEPCEAPFWFGLPSPFAADLEEVLVAQLDDLAQAVRA